MPIRVTPELQRLIDTGESLIADYPTQDQLTAARDRFTAPATLEAFERLAQRSEPSSLPSSKRPADGRPPRVAIATPDIVGPIRNGGIGTAYTSLAKALAAAGHDVTILFTLGRHSESRAIEDWVRHYAASHIRLVPMPGTQAPATFHGPAASFAAYRWLSGQSFDVIHFPEWGGTGFCAVQAKRVGLAFSRTTLCVGLHSPTLWHDLEDRQMVQRLDQLERDHLERRSTELADVVISPSRYLLRWIDRWGWRCPARTFVHPYVSPVSPMRPADRRPRAIRELVFFGRLESRKGLAIFCDALDLLTATKRLDGVSVTFLGKPGQVDGMDATAFLRERGAAWNSDWQIITDLGREQALDYLLARDALALMPSLADNTPNTVLECLAAGVPFLAAASGGIPEMVASADWPHALCEPNGAALAEAISARIAQGAVPSTPAISFDETRATWVSWHEDQIREPATPRAPRSTGHPAPSPCVSVCMATRNRAAYLDQALDSIRAQTMQDFEVVLIDDGSDDDHARRALDQLQPEFASRGWTLVRAPHRYPGAARNTAAVHARGRYLVFMDDDNLALPHELETLLHAAQVSGADIITCGHDGFSDEHGPTRVTDRLHRWLPIGAALPLGLFVNCVGDTNMLIGREAFFASGGFEEEPGAGLFEDWAFLWKALVRGARLEVVPDVLYLYRVGTHGSGQRSPAFDGYLRPIAPLGSLLPGGLTLALLFAAGAARPLALAGGPQRATPPDLVGFSPSPAASGPMPPFDRLHRSLIRLLQPHAADASEGDHLATSFARSEPSEIRVHFVPMHQVDIRVSGSDTHFITRGSDPQVAVIAAGSRQPTQVPWLLRLEMTSPAATYAQFFWRTTRAPFYCEAQSVRVPIGAGRNVRYIRIPASARRRRLRLDVSDIRAELILHDLDIRLENIRSS